MGPVHIEDHGPDSWYWIRPYRKVVRYMNIMCKKNKNRNRTVCQSPHENPAVEPSFDCATYILGPPKIQNCLLHQFPQSQCKLFNVMSLFYQSYLMCMLLDYLAVGHGSVLGVWAVVPSMYETYLKHRQCLQPISFNNIGPRLTCAIGVVWNAFIAGDNWCSLT